MKERQGFDTLPLFHLVQRTILERAIFPAAHRRQADQSIQESRVRRRRPTFAAMPANPVPSRSIVAGSGTAGPAGPYS